MYTDPVKMEDKTNDQTSIHKTKLHQPDFFSNVYV